MRFQPGKWHCHGEGPLVGEHTLDCGPALRDDLVDALDLTAAGLREIRATPTLATDNRCQCLHQISRVNLTCQVLRYRHHEGGFSIGVGSENHDAATKAFPQ